MPSRELVHQALRLRKEACRLIDSGLRRVDHELFAGEREVLSANRSCDIAAHLLMLPTSFYLSYNQIWEKPATAVAPPSGEPRKRVRDGPLLYLVGAEHHIPRTATSTFFVDGMFPLRIFTHPNADGFTTFLLITAERIVGEGQLEAYRIAARPQSLPYLLVTLVPAEYLTPHVLVDRISMFSQ